MTPDIRYIEDGAFLAHNGGPQVDAPRDWMVWHFTRVAYIPEIIDAGGLICDESVPPRLGSVASASVKALRRQRVIRAPGYPEGRRVSQHVPFYIAAKSPMLSYVSYNYPREVLDSLVFLGVRVGDIVDHGMEWVASNGNAATALTQFSADVDTLGTFVDFPLLCAKWWKNTDEDPDRKGRRSAEILVHDRVPLEAVSMVAGSNAATLETTSDLLGRNGYANIEYFETDLFTY